MKTYATGLPNGPYRVPGPASGGSLTRSKLLSGRTGDCSSLVDAEESSRARARKILDAEHGPEPCNSQYVLAQVNA